MLWNALITRLLHTECVRFFYGLHSNESSQGAHALLQKGDKNDISDKYSGTMTTFLHTLSTRCFETTKGIDRSRQNVVSIINNTGYLNPIESRRQRNTRVKTGCCHLSKLGVCSCVNKINLDVGYTIQSPSQFHSQS